MPNMNSSSMVMRLELIPVGEATVTMNAGQGTTVRLGNIIAIIWARYSC